MGSFTRVDQGHVAAANAITPSNPVTAGSIIVIGWGGENPGSGTVSPPTSCTDSNGNVYHYVGTLGSTQPWSLSAQNGACCAIYAGVFAIATPSNPATISLTGASNDTASGTPSIIYAVYTPPAGFMIAGGLVDSAVGFSASVSCTTIQATSVSAFGAGFGLHNPYPFGGPRCAEIVLMNMPTDALLIGLAYVSNFGQAWTVDVGATIIDQTTETNGASIVMAEYPITLSAGCGSMSLSVQCQNPPPATTGVPYSFQIGMAFGGTPPYVYSISGGALPPGITMDTTGLATGTATVAGTYNFTIEVIDSVGATATTPCAITVIQLVPRIAQGTYVVQSVRMTDANRQKTYKVTVIAGATIGNWLTGFKFFKGS